MESYSDILLYSLSTSSRTITLHSLKIMESFDNRFTSQVDFNDMEYTEDAIDNMILEFSGD
jgi:hypothetical protein